MGHNTIDYFTIMPTGNSFTDPDALSMSDPITINLIETTILSSSQTKFADLRLDTSNFSMTVNTSGASEMGVHLISVNLTDISGAFCLFEVFNVTVINTSPYFLTSPILNDLEVHFNSHVNQIMLPLSKDNESDTISLSVEFEYSPG
jgi:hypothetical protein